MDHERLPRDESHGRKAWMTVALAGLALSSLAGCVGRHQPDLDGLPSPSFSPSFPVPIRIGHVFVIVLENEDYDSTFAASPPPSPYLATTLPAQGRLLTQYYGIGHYSLDNYIAMVSGQAPNTATQADCV